MADQKGVIDSPIEKVNRHIQDYVETDGQQGHEWKGAPSLLLTTIGRKSGVRRRTALIYGTDGDRYVLVASHGGNAKHPEWYLNLTANPNVDVQIYGEQFEAVAHEVSGDEKARLWRMMNTLWHDYDHYQARTEREIPVLVLERKP